ncbi:MAG: CotH kinase family protein [Dehalococcoidia bacterium]|nr:CotH kinase family protein [Dehalococcoidia bacterium]
MNWERSTLLILLAGLIGMAMAGCGISANHSSNTAQPAHASQQQSRPEGWTEETHSSNVEPDYATVFPDDRVNQIKITVAAEDWNNMQANMSELFGIPGEGQQGAPPGAPGMPPDRKGMAPGKLPREGGIAPGAPGIPNWIDMTPQNPEWVPATIEFNSLTWTVVGFRYKGNSSLRSSWSSGSIKLPFKLDFDEFENFYPEIENQRFYGFKQLSFSTAFSDSTYMHDVIAADLLKEAGLTAAETTYYEVILDYGEGPVNLGLYVMVEVIDDTVIERFFGNDSGNIYEGDGPGASLAQGTFDQIQKSFLKENNEEEADWSDIEALYNAIHAEQRSSDPEKWRESLESVFDVDAFLEWLAIRSIIQHWDSYGQMPHNFYLYHDTNTGMLTWISWDHNQVLDSSGMGRAGGVHAPAGGMGRSVSLGREEVGENWPLIHYLLDDPVYYERYIDYIKETVDGAFDTEALEKKCREIAEMLAPYVSKESSEITFEAAVQEMITRIYERHQAATDFLSTQGGK